MCRPYVLPSQAYPFKGNGQRRGNNVSKLVSYTLSRPRRDIGPDRLAWHDKPGGFVGTATGSPKNRIFTDMEQFRRNRVELWVPRWVYRVVQVQQATWHAGTVDSDDFPWRYPRLSAGYHGPIVVFSEKPAPKTRITSTSLPWRTVPGTAI